MVGKCKCVTYAVRGTNNLFQYFIWYLTQYRVSENILQQMTTHKLEDMVSDGLKQIVF
jgi:hypothetical protein